MFPADEEGGGEATYTPEGINNTRDLPNLWIRGRGHGQQADELMRGWSSSDDAMKKLLHQLAASPAQPQQTVCGLAQHTEKLIMAHNELSSSVAWMQGLLQWVHSTMGRGWTSWYYWPLQV